jgi:uncharacterized protein (TIGR02466 family)
MSDLYNLFPTPVIRVPANENNYDIVQIEIKDAMEEIFKSKDASSLSYFYKGADAAKISEKTYDFIEKYNCVNLKNRILEAAHDYANKIGWQGPRDFEIKGSWLNITVKGDSHGHHCHPGYAISGTYYYRVSEEQGSISFNNPNPIMMHCQFPQGQLTTQTADIVPDDGDILLFPSWLMHTTRMNRSDEDRISIAFNIDYIGGDEIVFGLAKHSHTPIHRTEKSLKSILP